MISGGVVVGVDGEGLHARGLNGDGGHGEGVIDGGGGGGSERLGGVRKCHEGSDSKVEMHLLDNRPVRAADAIAPSTGAGRATTSASDEVRLTVHECLQLLTERERSRRGHGAHRAELRTG